uniref:VTE2-1 n=1 Tax=Arundo donax TaxID=35708 RepID=A0A0A9FUB0_ARUDO
MVKGGFVFPAKGPMVLPCLTVRQSSTGNPPIVGYHIGQ